MQKDQFSRNPVVTHGLDCFWLLTDSSLAHCYLGEKDPIVETIAFPIVLEDVKGLECDSRGRYLCIYESKRVIIAHLSLQKQGMNHRLSREGPFHVSSLELNKSDSPIVCVRCHPRITDCLVVVFQDGTLYTYNPLSSLKPVMELEVVKDPLDVCFGSGVGSDQFCLYVLDASQRISIVTPFPIVGYELPFDAYAKLLRKGQSWLLTWEEVNGKESQRMQTTVDTRWDTRIIPLSRVDASVRKGRLFVEPVSVDAISIFSVTDDCRLSVWIRFLDEPLDEESLVLVRSLSFASLGCAGIDRDVVPFAFLLRLPERVVSLRLPWLYDVVAGDSSSDARSLSPQFATVKEGAPKGSMAAANSPLLGHVLCEVTEQRIHLQRVDREPLSAISLAADIHTNGTGDAERHSSKPCAQIMESVSDAPGESSLDSLLEEMRANTTDLVSRYNEQLNATPQSDDHVDHSVLSRVLKEYVTPWIASLHKVKETLRQEASARAVDLLQAEDASSFLQKTLDEVESENAALETLTKEVIGKQEQLEETLQRVLEKLQDVLELPSEQEVLLQKEASSLSQRIQEMRHQIRNAEESVEVVEELRRKSQGQLKSSVVDKHVMRDLLSIQDTLQDSMTCKREVETLFREYERTSHQVAIEKRMEEMHLSCVCWDEGVVMKGNGMKEKEYMFIITKDSDLITDSNEE